MDTKDAEWLGVWHSITELPVASVRWAQTRSESRKKREKKKNLPVLQRFTSAANSHSHPDQAASSASD